MGVDNVDVTVWAHLDGPTWTQVGVIDMVSASSHEPRRLQPGPWYLQVPVTAQTLPLVTQGKQRLVTFDYRGQRFTGLVEHVGPASDEQGNLTLELSGRDTMALLGDVLCWPVPTGTLDVQSVARWTATGTVEDVLSTLIGVNYSRVYSGGLYEAVVARSLGRGGPATPPPSLRFHNLLARVTAWCANHGLGVAVGLVSHNDATTRADLTISFFTPDDQSNRVFLSPDLGTLRSWSQADDAPTGTRPISGGGGVGPLRVFRQVVAADAEAAWGRRIETFVDARDTTDLAELDARGLEELTNTAAQSSSDLTAADVQGLRYGDHYTVGDTVTVELFKGVEVATVLGAATIETGDAGVTVALKPGDPDGGNNWFRQNAILRGMRQAVQNLQQEP